MNNAAIKQNDEHDLLKNIKHSDLDAYQTIFTKYHSIIFKLVYSQVNDYDLAQDITQETFIKIWLKRNHLKPELSFLAFLIKISRNLIKDHFKREKVREKHKDSVPEMVKSIKDDPEQAFEISFLQEKIYQIVHNNLPEKCRLIFLLSRIEGKSNQAIADLYKISKKTVENQINHALKILHKKLAKYL